MSKKKLIEPVTILANGKYPSHHYPLEIIKNAETLISTDGSACRGLTRPTGCANRNGQGRAEIGGVSAKF